MKLSKADAAKAIGVSRQTLYAYINKGRISVDPDGTVDTAELLRAGFTLRQEGQQGSVETGHNLMPSNVQLDTYQEMIELLRQQLADAREREQAALERERAAREQLALLGTMLQEAQRYSQRLLDIPRQTPSTVPGPQRRSPAIPETWQRILDYMSQCNRSVRPTEVQEALGLTTPVRHAMRHMVEAGLLRRLEVGVYEVANPG